MTWQEDKDTANREYIAKREAEREAEAQKFRDEWLIYRTDGTQGVIDMPPEAAGFQTNSGEMSITDKQGNLLMVLAPGYWAYAQKWPLD